MNLLCFDLELNKPTRSIIQLGYCVGKTETGEILHSNSHYVFNKDLPEQIHPFITDLTGITQSQYESGISLPEAWIIMERIHREYQCFMNPLTWGHGDVECLKNSLGIYEAYPKIENSFGRRFIDAKTLYVSYRVANNKPVAGGLAKAMTKFGLAFDGRKHDAKDDAVNTFRIYHHMLGLMRA